MPLHGKYPVAQIAQGQHNVPPGSCDAEQFLTVANIGDGWLHPEASNYTFVVALEFEGNRGYGVYKPQVGEAPLWDFPTGTLYLRECAAYEMSKALGWGLVPPTVIRDGEAGEGSLQLFVPHLDNSNFFTFGDDQREEILRLAVFDLLVNNADRKGGHCFVGPDDTVWAIDNGLTFNVTQKLRTVIWDFAGQTVPATLLVDIARVGADLGSGRTLRMALENRIAETEILALEGRISRLLADPVLPWPQSRRDMPWPWI